MAAANATAANAIIKTVPGIKCASRPPVYAPAMPATPNNTAVRHRTARPRVGDNADDTGDSDHKQCGGDGVFGIHTGHVGQQWDRQDGATAAEQAERDPDQDGQGDGQRHHRELPVAHRRRPRLTGVPPGVSRCPVPRCGGVVVVVDRHHAVSGGGQQRRRDRGAVTGPDSAPHLTGRHIGEPVQQLMQRDMDCAEEVTLGLPAGAPHIGTTTRRWWRTWARSAKLAVG